MGKLVIVLCVLSVIVALAKCGEFDHQDFDIQIHPNHGHSYGLGDDGYSTSIRYDKRYTHEDIPDLFYHSVDPIAAYVSSAHSDSYSSGEGEGEGDGEAIDGDDEHYH